MDETGNLTEITIGNPEVRPLRRPGYRQKENIQHTDSICINVTLSQPDPSPRWAKECRPASWESIDDMDIQLLPSGYALNRPRGFLGGL